MKLTFPFRERFQGSGLSWLQNGLDILIGSIQAAYHVEHKADNTHSDIHADSLESTGAINVRNETQATITAWTRTANASLYTANVTNTQAGAGLFLTPEDPDFTSGFAIAAYPPIGADPPKVVFATGSGVLAYELDKGIRERSRTTAMGEWQAVSFNAGHYTGSGGMTVTVDSGDVAINRYTLVGKTLTWTLNVNTFTLAAANGNINVTIPGGFTAAQTGNVGVGLHSNNGGGWEPVIIGTSASASTISVVSLPSFTWTGAGTNNNYFSFTVTFEIQ